MIDDTTQRMLDADDHRKTYSGIMRAAGEVGVPFSIALTVFFTNLVLANGIGVAIVAGVLSYLFVYFVVRTFFSH